MAIMNGGPNDMSIEERGKEWQLNVDKSRWLCFIFIFSMPLFISCNRLAFRGTKVPFHMFHTL